MNDIQVFWIEDDMEAIVIETVNMCGALNMFLIEQNKYHQIPIQSSPYIPHPNKAEETHDGEKIYGLSPDGKSNREVFSIPKGDMGILNQLPDRAIKEFNENIHKYVEQIGREYGVGPQDNGVG